MAKIKKITAREVLDSRGIPTVAARLVMDDDTSVSAAAPSGESLGKYEGIELRDGDMSRYNGLGVIKAVSYINDLISPKLIGVDPTLQQQIDYWLAKADGTEESSKLGINVVMTISQLILKAGARSRKKEIYRYINELYDKLTGTNTPLEKMPALITTMINGGKHGTRNLEFQEFQIIPQTSLSFSQSLAFVVTTYARLKQVLEYRNAGIAVSEEGGFVPNLLTNVDALEVIKETLIQGKSRLGVDVYLGLDLAASQFYKDGKYIIKDKSQSLKIDEYIEFIVYLNKEYTILVLEDPLEQEDFNAWSKLNEKIGANTYLAGDDFLAGKKTRVEKAIKTKACSAIVIKFNQSPTITHMLELIQQARLANLKIIFSHRLGESNDSIIADFAVGIQSDFVKFGAPSRGERVAKYNRLLEIESALKPQ